MYVVADRDRRTQRRLRGGAPECPDGFSCAGADRLCRRVRRGLLGRPEAYLDSAVRAGISSLALLSPADAERGAARLREDLESGAWDARFGHLRELPELDLGYRLVVAG